MVIDRALSKIVFPRNYDICAMRPLKHIKYIDCIATGLNDVNRIDFFCYTLCA